MTKKTKRNEEIQDLESQEQEILEPGAENLETVDAPESGAAAAAGTGEEEAAREGNGVGGNQDAAESDSYRDQYLRLRADFENFRKRTRREKEEWTQRCLENLCGDLLTVLDHFDLGLENGKGVEAAEDVVKGFDLVRGQLGTVLGKYGLSPLVAEDGPFDPNRQEAITHLPSPEVPEGHVVAMTRKGYLMGDRLLRPVQVVVSAGEPETDSASGEDA